MVKNQEIERTLNFAEAEVKDVETTRLFRDYADKRFLVGYVPEKSKDWVRRNRLYNIRVDAENCKGGVDETNPASYAVDYLVLYENRYNNRYRIYKTGHWETIGDEK